MKYIIMCGGNYGWHKQLVEIKGEKLVERTIRLLQENGIEDIAISSNDPIFEQFGVPVLHHENNFLNGSLYWVDAFYPMDTPVCYLFGDVYYSEYAIYQIINTEVGDIMFFASAPPFSSRYPKKWAEPFAFKVVDTDKFNKCVVKTKELQDKGMFSRIPIAWELWQVIQGTKLNHIDYTSYHVINDTTCDIDTEADMARLHLAGEI